MPPGATAAHTISPREPPRPEITYSPKNRQWPIIRSSTGPTEYRAIMLNRICNSEFGACRNIEVMSVHGSATSLTGAAMPRYINQVLRPGAINPSNTSSSHTATHATISAQVITGPPRSHWYRISRCVGICMQPTVSKVSDAFHAPRRCRAGQGQTGADESPTNVIPPNRHKQRPRIGSRVGLNGHTDQTIPRERSRHGEQVF